MHYKAMKIYDIIDKYPNRNNINRIYISYDFI